MLKAGQGGRLRLHSSKGGVVLVAVAAGLAAGMTGRAGNGAVVLIGLAVGTGFATALFQQTLP